MRILKILSSIVNNMLAGEKTTWLYYDFNNMKFELLVTTWEPKNKQSNKIVANIITLLRSLTMLCGTTIEPNISFEFVPIGRPHPSTTTYVHLGPPIA